MKRHTGKLAALGFAVAVALLMFWPKQDDPAMMRQVSCTADAFVIVDHFRILDEAGAEQDAAQVEKWREIWDRLNREVTSLRRTGRAEPAYLGGMIAKARAGRDSRIEAGETDAWLDETKARVEGC